MERDVAPNKNSIKSGGGNAQEKCHSIKKILSQEQRGDKNRATGLCVNYARMPAKLCDPIAVMQQSKGAFLKVSSLV
jgi:hypothetical protein